MSAHDTDAETDAGAAAAGREGIPAAARRALAEAAERRRKALTPAGGPELGGRAGPDPARFGDWEVNGVATDF